MFILARQSRAKMDKPPVIERNERGAATETGYRNEGILGIIAASLRENREEVCREEEGWKEAIRKVLEEQFRECASPEDPITARSQSVDAPGASTESCEIHS